MFQYIDTFNQLNNALVSKSANWVIVYIATNLMKRVKRVVKIIEAYYRTENDAESVKAKLETLKVDNVLVERISDPNSRNKFMEIIKDMVTADNGDNHDPQVLHVEVAEDDFTEASKIVHESNGFISKE